MLSLWVAVYVVYVVVLCVLWQVWCGHVYACACVVCVMSACCTVHLPMWHYCLCVLCACFALCVLRVPGGLFEELVLVIVETDAGKPQSIRIVQQAGNPGIVNAAVSVQRPRTASCLREIFVFIYLGDWM